MKDLVWDRTATIKTLRGDVWRYVSQASQTEENMVLRAAALLQMPPGEVRYLAQLQFILSESVGRLLEEVPRLVRRLTTTTTPQTEISTERIRGSIRWGETFAERAATGLPHAYVTAPTRRAFDTPENQVLAFALSAIGEFGRRTGWHRGTTEGPARQVRSRVAEATRWGQSRMLQDVSSIPPAAKTLSRVRASRSRRRYQSALDVVDLYQRYIARLDRDAVREAVENHALVVSRDPALFELQCAFETVRALRRLGWKAPHQGLLRPPEIFHGRRGDEELKVYFQHTPPALGLQSRYRGVQKAHGFSRASQLLPDLVLGLTVDGRTRWLLVEVKLSQTGVATAARRAAQDLLGYRRAFDAVLGRQSGTYGIGFAWGAGLEPSADAEVGLCTPDTLDAALELHLPR